MLHGVHSTSSLSIVKPDTPHPVYQLLINMGPFNAHNVTGFQKLTFIKAYESVKLWTDPRIDLQTRWDDLAFFRSSEMAVQMKYSLNKSADWKLTKSYIDAQDITELDAQLRDHLLLEINAEKYWEDLVNHRVSDAVWEAGKPEREKDLMAFYIQLPPEHQMYWNQPEYQDYLHRVPDAEWEALKAERKQCTDKYRDELHSALEDDHRGRKVVLLSWLSRTNRSRQHFARINKTIYRSDLDQYLHEEYLNILRR